MPGLYKFWNNRSAASFIKHQASLGNAIQPSPLIFLQRVETHCYKCFVPMALLWFFCNGFI